MLGALGNHLRWTRGWKQCRTMGQNIYAVMKAFGRSDRCGGPIHPDALGFLNWIAVKLGDLGAPRI